MFFPAQLGHTISTMHVVLTQKQSKLSLLGHFFPVFGLKKMLFFVIKLHVAQFFCFQNSFFSFTEEQAKVMRTAEAFHNLLLAGQAGNGKSHVVKGLVQKLQSRGRKVVVVCSSVISSSVYGDGVKSSTVHSHYALQTADMPAELVVARATALPNCVARIKVADTIIWDEAGM